jgi:hypothetical protein
MVETAWMDQSLGNELPGRNKTRPTEISDPVPNEHALEIDRRLLLLDERLVTVDNSGREEREVSALTRMHQYRRRHRPGATQRMREAGLDSTHTVRFAGHVELATLKLLERLEELMLRERRNSTCGRYKVGTYDGDECLNILGSVLCRRHGLEPASA